MHYALLRQYVQQRGEGREPDGNPFKLSVPQTGTISMNLIYKAKVLCRLNNEAVKEQIPLRSHRLYRKDGRSHCAITHCQ